jgi:hypothetical protein
LAILSAAVVALACGGGGAHEPEGTRAPVPPPNPQASRSGTAGTRLILIYDPTAYLHADTTVVNRQVFGPLKRFVTELPPRTIVDFYIVAKDGMNRPLDEQATLAFDPREPNLNAHKRRAAAAADRLSAQGMEQWASTRQRLQQPASCILSTLRRTRASLEQAALANEKVAIVLVSDLLEVCDDFGRFNFEAAIPDSFGRLPDRVDLSRVNAIHIVELEHPSVSDVGAATRLDSVWVRLVRSWGAPADGISLRATYPARLLRPAASSGGDR